MTSVRNHLQLLNGSKVLGLIGILVFAISCTPSRQASSGDNNAARKGPMVYNPKTGEYEPAGDRNLVDTARWRTDPNAAPPISASKSKTARFKEVYNVDLLIPFEANRINFSGESINPKSSRFLHYYAGMKIAFDELSHEGVKLNIRVNDTRESASTVENQLDEMKDADAIIGPYDKESLKVAARFAEKNGIPVISPWTPSITIDQPSEYFVQVTPGLPAHASATMSFISRSFKNPEVFIVGLNGGSTRSRTEIYRTAYRNVFGNTEAVRELNLPSGEFDFPDMDILSMLYDDRPNIFILPFYLQNEQEFINAILRKLHAEKGEKEVYVFGLPQWLSFYSVNPDYLESLQAYVTAVQFVDMTDPEVRLFTEEFFRRYSTVPEPAAWQGYELAMFVGKSLKEYGTGFLDEISSSTPKGPLKLMPVFESDSRPEGRNRVMYFENQNIDILKFMDYTFNKVN